MARLGIIGGTGAAQLAALLAESAGGEAAESHDVESRFSSNPVPLALWRYGSHEVFFIERHGPDAVVPPHRVNYRANIDALRIIEADFVVSMNAVGGITTDGDAGAPGGLVLPHQIIDYTWGREHTFYDGNAAELDHIEFTRPFSEPLRQLLLTAAGASGVQLRAQAVLGVTQGPRLETAAEIDRLERDGCDIVGMTAMPEAALAVEAGLEYASLCGVVNAAAGRSAAPIHDQIEACVSSCMAQSRSIVEELLAGLTTG